MEFASSPAQAQVIVSEMLPADWPNVAAIYVEGLRTGNASFETLAPTWEQFDRSHLGIARLVARRGRSMAGWAALSRVSQRSCYAGVADLSIYVASWARSEGVGDALMKAAIAASEAAGIWTLQGSIFPENKASLALCTRNGFREVGRRVRIGQRDGQWRDTILVERRSQTIGV